MTTHIYREVSQPATRFCDRHVDPPMWFRCKPRRQMFARCCKRRRWAKYLRVQVYYDGTYVWCADGHGCKA